jgi:hypothetical protein
MCQLKYHIKQYKAFCCKNNSDNATTIHHTGNWNNLSSMIHKLYVWLSFPTFLWIKPIHHSQHRWLQLILVELWMVLTMKWLNAECKVAKSSARPCKRTDRCQSRTRKCSSPTNLTRQRSTHRSSNNSSCILQASNTIFKFQARTDPPIEPMEFIISCIIT